MKFISEIIGELKNVTWPTRRETAGLTAYVVVICAILALITLGLDLSFINIRDIILEL